MDWNTFNTFYTNSGIGNWELIDRANSPTGTYTITTSGTTSNNRIYDWITAYTPVVWSTTTTADYVPQELQYNDYCSRDLLDAIAYGNYTIAHDEQNKEKNAKEDIKEARLSRESDKSFGDFLNSFGKRKEAKA